MFEVKSKGKILAVKEYLKKDKVTKENTGEVGISLQILAFGADVMDITQSKVIDTYIGNAFRGEFEKEFYEPCQDVEYILDFTPGSEYFNLVDISPILKK